MAWTLLEAAWKARTLGRSPLASPEKLVLVRLADYWRPIDKRNPHDGAAAISMEQLAADCALSEPGLRGILRRLLMHTGCPVHLGEPREADNLPHTHCRRCVTPFEPVGCLVIREIETATRARRYDLVLDHLRGKRGYPLGRGSVPFSDEEVKLMEGNGLPLWGQPGCRVEGNPVGVSGKAGYPVPDLPSLPSPSVKITGADAPERAQEDLQQTSNPETVEAARLALKQQVQKIAAASRKRVPARSRAS